ncbi:MULTISPECIES: hypothetical protein [Corynebacterium]|jgi:hypothetical protein|uniref:Uncharacterized protein n=1 Tax=Corynebacterium provencense TaxID=1737425 RepID=A0A2Z3YS49_9CORY|nr:MULTISPECIES: hypothetical protein [Corynebacterium]AWT26491.1 hypothetical protein Csp1_17090 [Corynebacterium provencense]MCI1257521.1 hypothetical protein [Corynebacterium provencense]
MRETLAADGHADRVAAAGDLVDAVSSAAVDCVGRSAVVRRLSAGELPFAGRAAWLEQHWEGLRILRDCPLVPVPVRHELTTTTDRLNTALDRAHAGARWRDRHVTMPSMFTFRRHVTSLKDAGDLLGLTAEAHVRLLCAGVGSGVAGAESHTRSTSAVRSVLCSLVTDDEDLERLSEELSAGLFMVMQHGSDVCRAYQGAGPDQICAVTVATIRHALR